EGAGDLQLRGIGAGGIGSGGDLIAPGREGAAHVAEAHVEIAQALAGLEGLGSHGIPLHQLAVLLGGAARVVEVERAEIARELERAAANGILRLAALVSEREEEGAALEECGAVVPGEREIARLLQARRGALRASGHEKRAKNEKTRAPHGDRVPLHARLSQRSASAAPSRGVGRGRYLSAWLRRRTVVVLAARALRLLQYRSGGVGLALFGRARGADHLLAFLAQVDEPHALRVAPAHGDLRHPHAD